MSHRMETALMPRVLDNALAVALFAVLIAAMGWSGWQIISAATGWALAAVIGWVWEHRKANRASTCR